MQQQNCLTNGKHSSTLTTQPTKQPPKGRMTPEIRIELEKRAAQVCTLQQAEALRKEYLSYRQTGMKDWNRFVQETTIRNSLV